MKRILVFLLSLIFVFTAYMPHGALAEAALSVPGNSFSGLGDPTLLQHVQDSVYADLVNELDSNAFFVENVSAIYISKEYLDELAYNSQANIYFGYTLAELEEQFQGTKFIFTLGEDGQTAVREFEDYKDPYEKMIRDVAIGSGVILLCVTVSVVSAGVGAPAVSVIFAASAKTATTFALSGGVFSGAAAGIVTGIQTKDFDKAMQSAALAGSEGFKWGAVTGALAGGAGEVIALKGATLNGLTMNQAAAIQRESKYPLDVIKGFKTVEQYEIAKKAGLVTETINGKAALVRKIDLKYIDEFGRTNLQRMQKGLAALDPTGNAYELHHIGQKVDSTLAILTKAEHMQGGNNGIWHIFGESSKVHDLGNKWPAQKKAFWEAMATSAL